MDVRNREKEKSGEIWIIQYFILLKKNPNVVNFTRKQRKHPYSIVTQDGETRRK